MLPIALWVFSADKCSTGGLIALGLASMNWSVEECIDHFEELCNEAFTRRTGSTLPLIGPFIDNYHHSRYQTSTLEKALVKAFTNDLYLFGGQRPAESNVMRVKAAVIATSLAGNKTYVLSNYNRPRDDHSQSKPHIILVQLKYQGTIPSNMLTKIQFTTISSVPS